MSKIYLAKASTKMIMKIFFVSLVLIFTNTLALSANDSSNVQKDNIIITDKSRLIMKNATKKLYKELMSFKDDKQFHNVGFDVRYKYNKWLITLDKTKENWHTLTMSAPITERMDDKNMNLSTSISYLRLIATNYMRNKGNNDNFTNEQLPNIRKILQIK